MSGDRALGRVKEEARMLEKRSSAVVDLVWCFRDVVFGWLIVGGQAVRCDIQLCIER